VNRRTWVASTVFALLFATGCIRIETTTVRVRDPQQVEVLADGARIPLQAQGPSSAPVSSGRFAQWLSLRPYEIDVDRKPGGVLALRCDACGDAGWSPNRTGSTREDTLLDANGALATTWTRLVTSEKHSVPIRPLGWGALAIGLGLLGVSTFVLASNDFGSFGQRAPWGFGIALPALALAGWGAWEALAPAEDEVTVR